jgi:hypothetical protein
VAPVDRRCLFTRESKERKIDLKDLLLALNKAIQQEKYPDHVRLLSLSYTPTGAISGLLKEKALVGMLEPIKKILLDVVKKFDPTVKDLKQAEQWYKLKIHKIPLNRYLKNEGLSLIKEEIETTTGLELPLPPRWLGKDLEKRYNRDEIAFSSIIITVRSKSLSDRIIAKGLFFGGQNHKSERFIEARPQELCLNCYQFGHNKYQKCENRLKCYLCGGNHSGLEHKCLIKGCTAKTSQICTHIEARCVNCLGTHITTSETCPKKREIIRQEKEKKEKALEQRKNPIEVVITQPRDITANIDTTRKEKPLVVKKRQDLVGIAITQPENIAITIVDT